MSAPLSHSVKSADSVIKDSLIPAASVVSKSETTAAAAPEVFSKEAVVYIDLDFLDSNKTISGTPYRRSTQAWR
jgi:hypothetical protein